MTLPRGLTRETVAVRPVSPARYNQSTHMARDAKSVGPIAGPPAGDPGDVADDFDPAQAERDLTLLLRALTEALGVLSTGGDRATALRESFVHAQRGLRALKALLLYVRSSHPLELEILYSSGLTFEQQQACLALESTRGVSPSVIRQVIKERQSVFIPNAQARDDKFHRTASLSEGTQSVLCTPIFDPLTSAPMAVLYFQNEGLLFAFSEEDHEWLKGYATALQQGIALHVNVMRRVEGLEHDRKRLIEAAGGGPELIGDSEDVRSLRRTLDETLLPAVDLPNPKPILILGPRGTGKDLVARYLHYYSTRRRNGKFVAFNCAGLRGDLAEARLFGYVKGAFTGADRDSAGLFREADGGVLFLDEIGQMPLEGQALLLRVIESRRVQAIGEVREHAVDVQLVTATNRDLRAESEAGRFLADLYDRIRALPIQLKPLESSARRADIRPLVTHFLSLYERAHHKKTLGLTHDAFLALLNYSWPGNVRAIDNLCASLITYARPGAQITLQDVLRHAPEVADPAKRHPDAETFVDDDAAYGEAHRVWERELFRRRMERYANNQAKVRKSLGISRATFYRLLERSGLREG
jgi:DNA-binding NtrC family response regulator